MQLPLFGKVNKPSRWLIGLAGAGLLGTATTYLTGRKHGWTLLKASGWRLRRSMLTSYAAASPCWE